MGRRNALKRVLFDVDDEYTETSYTAWSGDNNIVVKKLGPFVWRPAKHR